MIEENAISYHEWAAACLANAATGFTGWYVGGKVRMTAYGEKGNAISSFEHEANDKATDPLGVATWA